MVEALLAARGILPGADAEARTPELAPVGNPPTRPVAQLPGVATPGPSADGVWVCVGYGGYPEMGLICTWIEIIVTCGMGFDYEERSVHTDQQQRTHRRLPARRLPVGQRQHQRRELQHQRRGRNGSPGGGVHALLHQCDTRDDGRVLGIGPRRGDGDARLRVVLNDGSDQLGESALRMERNGDDDDGRYGRDLRSDGGHRGIHGDGDRHGDGPRGRVDVARGRGPRRAERRHTGQMLRGGVPQV